MKYTERKFEDLPKDSEGYVFLNVELQVNSPEQAETLLVDILTQFKGAVINVFGAEAGYDAIVKLPLTEVYELQKAIGVKSVKPMRSRPAEQELIRNSQPLLGLNQHPLHGLQRA